MFVACCAENFERSPYLECIRNHIGKIELATVITLAAITTLLILGTTWMNSGLEDYAYQGEIMLYTAGALATALIIIEGTLGILHSRHYHANHYKRM